ncbi:MAG TPA: hypothetical protein VEB22_09825 [Phycisphaerales bacterium]|nr:hypothetical protein [Phycisphaerales bacterium]
MSAPAPVTLESFDACTIPLAAWNHLAHLTVAYLLLTAHPLEEATRRMQAGVRKYNAANGIQQTPIGGYHDTLTIAWMRILHATMSAYGRAESADDFLQQHPHLLSKVLLRLYYSRPRIMSHDARHGWVEPDLAPLPRAPAAPTP